MIPYAPGGPFILAVNVDGVSTPTFVEFGDAHSFTAGFPLDFEMDNAFVVPRAGTLTGLFVNITSIVGLPAGVSVRAVIRRSAACNGAFADTPLAIVAPAAGCFSVAGAVAVAPNDAISLEFELVGAITAGLSVTVNGSAGLAYT